MKYIRCEELCDKIAVSPEASLLKGKALYYIYQTKQRQLRMQQANLQHRDFFIRHRACYNMAKEVVKIFSHAKDSGYAGMDPICNQMLDFAIMDYLLETNKLKELNRCFLCLKKPKLIAEEKSVQLGTQSCKKAVTEVEQSEASKELKPKQARKVGIHASHLIPHSIIRYLMKDVPELPGSKHVIFGVSGSKLKNVMKRTPATSSIYMLCSLCEHNLNVLGEQPFLGFLKKVYDPSCGKTETIHTYGTEMYHFCMGLIFRTLCPSQDDYINVDEVYQLLLQCRAFLTTDSPLEAVSKVPEVCMFVCSCEKDDSDETFHAFITENSASYTAMISLDCQLEELGTFVSVLANFFMVKIGTIIIVVKFSPARKQLINERFHINPQGGSYSIPSSKARRELVPAGLWTALHLLYESYKTDVRKSQV